MKLLRRIVIGFVVFFSGSVSAADLVLEAGLHSGGDTLATAQFIDGSTESIKAGGFVSVAIGANFAINEELESQVTFGYKFDSVDAENGDIEFSRFPINALVLYKLDEWRLGGGLTYHLDPSLEVSGAGAGFASNTDYDDALGFLLDARYFFAQRAYVGARLTFIEYESQAGATFDGNSVGVVIGGVI